MGNAYLALKEKRQKEVNEFPMFFAFDRQQFAKGLESFGLNQKNYSDKLCTIPGGGYILKADAGKFAEMFDRHGKETQEAINNDLTGEGFIYEMFDYELANHEYGYTWDLEPTLSALGFTLKEVKNNPKLWNGLEKARKNQNKE